VDPSFCFNADSTGVPKLVVDPAEVSRRRGSMSPIVHVSADDPPVLVVHWDNDQARDAGVPARLIVRRGKGHAWQGWEADGDVIAEWFDAQLFR
jgi:hypothetical protein